MNAAVSVRQLNLYVKSLIDGDARLSDITVTGEISNFKNHYASGHWYFTLKDSDATVRCVMFRSAAAKVRCEVSDGLSVTLRGRVSLYERDGQYQLYVEELSAGSTGDLARLFEQTKQKLLAEGLFDESHKRPLPAFPKRIAVITSATGAAVQDILNITGRRYPLCDIMICPVAVQGESAVGEMTDALERVYRRDDTDLIIIGRGGGSAEDLAAFNDESLARKIYESPIPVISAVGHETDFSICDFVADLRAPTPSAAAEIAVPDLSELAGRIAGLKRTAKNSLFNCWQRENARYEKAMSASVFRRPLSEIAEKRGQILDRLSERLKMSVERQLDNNLNVFSHTVSKLDALSPLKVMARGFAAVEDENGLIGTVDRLKVGKNITLHMADGTAECIVEEINNG